MSTFGAFTVTRASTKNVLGDAGLYVSVANDTPAFEFNTDGSYRGLLVEPGATNLALHSQDFTNAAWVNIAQGAGSAPVVTANYTTAPDGTNTGTRLECDLNGGSTTGDRSWLQQSIVGTAVPANASLFVKLNSPGTATFALNINDTASVTVTSTDWVRVGTVRTSATANYAFRIGLIGGSGQSDTIDISIWQAQLETGSVATSPIVTTAGTASRVADVVSLTGASSLIGQTEGSAYVEIVALNFNSATSRRVLTLSDGTTSNRIGIAGFPGQNNRYQAIVANTVGGITAQIIQSADVTENTVIKLAMGYAVDDIAFYINGASIGTDTSSAIPACSRIDIGSQIGAEQFINGHIRSVALFPTRLANATLASLTA
jgi:hypothetical protein